MTQTLRADVPVDPEPGRAGPLDADAAAEAGRLRAIVRDVAETAGQVAVTVTDVSGAVASISATMQDQAVRSENLRSGAARVRGHGDRVLDSAMAASETARAANDQATSSLGDARSAFAEVSELAVWVTAILDRFTSLSGDLDALVRTTGRVDGIARETHILALNARIEAARSGSGGAGFQVIADSVRSLASQTLAMAGEMTATLLSLGEYVDKIKKEGHDARAHAESVHRSTQTLADSIETIGGCVATLDGRVAEITAAAGESQRELVAFVDDLDGFASGVEAASRGLLEAGERSTALAEQGEELLQLSVRAGVRTVDTPFVEQALSTAARIQERFEAAVASHEIALDDLFDTAYTPVPGTDPVQHLVRYLAFTDRVLPSFQEAVLESDERIAFCACVDRNGYLPTHNLVYSKPQGDDPVWNAANCRNRRIFDDRAGSRAGRTSRDFLLQTYRRDMGGGRFVTMKEVDAPLWVAGRHFGALRLAYRIS